MDQTEPFESGSQPPDSAPRGAAERFVVGNLVGRYRLRRFLGRGGMGEVFLARDTVLGRAVALKQLRTDRLSSAELEPLLDEARITARLNHPNIVQLYDVGRHGETAFLTLEYLDGESLAARLRHGTLSLEEVLAIARGIAAALLHAHGVGVRHCDLKPSNVMLPSDGRVRVVDFGLATLAGVRVAGGTPDAMAPEQWRGNSSTDRTDIWAFAVLLHRLLDANHPFGPAETADARRAAVLDETRDPSPPMRSGVPDGIRALLVRSLQRDERARPSAAAWVEALHTPADGAAQDAPFRGLAAFDEQHAGFFFGREAESDAYLERLRSTPILPVVGPSGAGKSSFLHAGVVPRLRARGGWLTVAVRPGREPFKALARNLLAAGADHVGEDDVARLAEELSATPSLLAARLASIAAARNASVFVVCDQLEELFTHTNEETAGRFVAMVMAAVADPEEPIRISFSLRDDFVGRVAALTHVFVLKRLTGADLRRTVVGPLHRLGYRFERPEIVDAMLAEVHDSPFELPLLQFACRSLWEARDLATRTIPESAYRERSVAGALAEHADAVIHELMPSQQRIARLVLGRLVAGTTSRRTLALHDLLDGLPADADRVVERLVAARLLVQRRAFEGGPIVVEIAHESLLVTWQRLVVWLEESHEERRVVQELDELAASWRKRGKRPEHTLGNDELAVARERLARLGAAVPLAIEEFFAAGEVRRDALRRRKQRQIAVVVASAMVVALVSLGLAHSFRAQKNAAEEQAAALALAAANEGVLELDVTVLERVPEGGAVPVAELPDLEVAVFAASEDGRHPTEELPARISRRGNTFVIAARGGQTFLRFVGRGRGTCAASWLRVMAFPGYAEHQRRVAVAIPSCDASARDTVRVPAGPFIYGGAGEPATKFDDYTQDEHVVELRAFEIDRTEVSNATFRRFADLARVSGYPVPIYAGPEGGDAYPVTSIDAYEAEAFCRFMGKRLPSDYEWTKAFRGGLTLPEGTNPHPRRLYPWGGAFDSRCVNLAGDRDGFDWVAPVDAQSCGASPYGVIGLAGNVAEWIAMKDQTALEPLRTVRGGNAESPLELEQTTSVFRNLREARHFDFVTGVRCVASTEEDHAWVP